MCKECKIRIENEHRYLNQLDELRREKERFYSFILGIKNLIESLDEFSWRE